jgi:hypothetical protein
MSITRSADREAGGRSRERKSRAGVAYRSNPAGLVPVVK